MIGKDQSGPEAHPARPPLPVVMYFPVSYVAEETRRFQLSQHLAMHRQVLFVQDEGTRHRFPTPTPRFVPTGPLGNVEVLDRQVGRGFHRLRRSAPNLLARLHEGALHRRLRAMGIERYWTYTSHPTEEWRPLPRPGVLRGLEWNDPVFSGPTDAVWAAAAERARAADLVTVTATDLGSELRRYGVASLVLKNAATAPIADARRTRAWPPVALYVGALDWRFDTDLVGAVGRLLPSIRFVIAGRINPDLAAAARRLGTEPNVEVLGPIPERQKTALLRTASVGIVPFRRGRISDGVDPTKVYEYASYGLPVVSVDSLACRELSPPVRTAPDAHRFAAAVTEAVTDDPVASGAKSLAFAASNTWAQRAATLDAWLRDRER